jgi:hypothetical protein
MFDGRGGRSTELVRIAALQMESECPFCLSIINCSTSAAAFSIGRPSLESRRATSARSLRIRSRASRLVKILVHAESTGRSSSGYGQHRLLDLCFAGFASCSCVGRRARLNTSEVLVIGATNAAADEFARQVSPVGSLDRWGFASNIKKATESQSVEP